MRLEEGHSKKERTYKFSNNRKIKWSILLLILIILPITVQHYTTSTLSSSSRSLVSIMIPARSTAEEAIL